MATRQGSGLVMNAWLAGQSGTLKLFGKLVEVETFLKIKLTKK